MTAEEPRPAYRRPPSHRTTPSTAPPLLQPTATTTAAPGHPPRRLQMAERRPDSSCATKPDPPRLFRARKGPRPLPSRAHSTLARQTVPGHKTGDPMAEQRQRNDLTRARPRPRASPPNHHTTPPTQRSNPTHPRPRRPSRPSRGTPAASRGRRRLRGARRSAYQPASSAGPAAANEERPHPTHTQRGSPVHGDDSTDTSNRHQPRKPTPRPQGVNPSDRRARARDAASHSYQQRPFPEDIVVPRDGPRSAPEHLCSSHPRQHVLPACENTRTNLLIEISSKTGLALPVRPLRSSDAELQSAHRPPPSRRRPTPQRTRHTKEQTRGRANGAKRQTPSPANVQKAPSDGASTNPDCNQVRHGPRHPYRAMIGLGLFHDPHTPARTGLAPPDPAARTANRDKGTPHDRAPTEDSSAQERPANQHYTPEPPAQPNCDSHPAPRLPHSPGPRTPRNPTACTPQRTHKGAQARPSLVHPADPYKALPRTAPPRPRKNPRTSRPRNTARHQPDNEDKKSHQRRKTTSRNPPASREELTGSPADHPPQLGPSRPRPGAVRAQGKRPCAREQPGQPQHTTIQVPEPPHTPSQNRRPPTPRRPALGLDTKLPPDVSPHPHPVRHTKPPRATPPSSKHTPHPPFPAHRYRIREPPTTSGNPAPLPTDTPKPPKRAHHS